jgi:hypothetical protein
MESLTFNYKFRHSMIMNNNANRETEKNQYLKKTFNRIGLFLLIVTLVVYYVLSIQFILS